MKITEISKGIYTIIEAIDFITNQIDSDETGNGDELIKSLFELKSLLQTEIHNRLVKYYIKKAKPYPHR